MTPVEIAFVAGSAVSGMLLFLALWRAVEWLRRPRKAKAAPAAAVAAANTVVVASNPEALFPPEDEQATGTAAADAESHPIEDGPAADAIAVDDLLEPGRAAAPSGLDEAEAAVTSLAGGICEFVCRNGLHSYSLDGNRSNVNRRVNAARLRGNPGQTRKRKPSPDGRARLHQQEIFMTRLLLASVSFGAIVASAGVAAADCGIPAGSVRILSNDFEALHVVAAGAEECATSTVTVTKNQTAEHKNIQVAALTTNPATYTVAVIANNSIVPLLNDGLIRPLDDYVAKYGQDLQESQLVRIDGKVMAIAFMVNAQHLIYRKDLIEAAGLEPPATYEDVLAAAEVLREKGLIETPLAANFKPGWDVASEFVNIYLGYGGEFFEPGTANLTIDNENAVKALDTMKAMAGYMSPDFATFDSNSVKPVWEAGQAAIVTGAWGSRVGAMIDPEGPAPDVAAQTVLAAAPMAGGGDTPAAALWWDGFTIAQNISDEDAEASFRAMVNGIRPEIAQDHATVAAWLIKGYEPTAAAVGVFETAKAGAKPYPMVPYMGLLHTALGNELAEFMQGQEDASKALTDVTQAYDAAAREGGFLN